MLYPAPRRKVGAVPRGAALIEHRAADGAPVQVLWLAPPAGARTVVYFHGNGETIGDMVDVTARPLAERGLGVALVEYRGYGGSPAADPTEAGLYADAEGVLGALAARGVGPDEVVLWGRSLGSVSSELRSG